MEVNELDRLHVLTDKLSNHTATDTEKDEFMTILHKHNKIDKKHYQYYKNGKLKEHSLKTALIVGHAVCIGYLLLKKIKNKRKT